MMMMMDGGTQRYRMEFYAQAFNVLNRDELLRTSSATCGRPSSATPTSAGPARRIEVGINFGF